MFLHFCSLMPFEKKDDIWLDELKCTKDLAFLLMQQYELISCHTKNQRVVFSALCRNKLFTFKLIIFVSLRFNHQSLHHPIQIQYQWCQPLKSCDQIVQNPSVNYVQWYQNLSRHFQRVYFHKDWKKVKMADFSLLKSSKIEICTFLLAENPQKLNFGLYPHFCQNCGFHYFLKYSW